MTGDTVMRRVREEHIRVVFSPQSVSSLRKKPILVKRNQTFHLRDSSSSDFLNARSASLFRPTFL